MISTKSQIPNTKNHTKKYWSLGIEIWNLRSLWNLRFGIWTLEFRHWNLRLGIWNLNFGILLLLLFGIFTSCSNKRFNSKEEMITYIKNPTNGYLQEKTVNNVSYSLLYKPTDLLVEQELTQVPDSVRKAKISILREKYNKYMYFVLSMSRNGQELLNSSTGSRAEFGAMVNQLAFDMEDKVHLYTQQKDTLMLMDYIYPRTYGMTPNTTMLFVFPKDKKYLEKDELSFTIEDLGFYTGEVKFKVPINNIVTEPKLEL